MAVRNNIDCVLITKRNYTKYLQLHCSFLQHLSNTNAYIFPEAEKSETEIKKNEWMVWWRIKLGGSDVLRQYKEEDSRPKLYISSLEAKILPQDIHHCMLHTHTHTYIYIYVYSPPRSTYNWSVTVSHYLWLKAVRNHKNRSLSYNDDVLDDGGPTKRMNTRTNRQTYRCYFA